MVSKVSQTLSSSGRLNCQEGSGIWPLCQNPCTREFIIRLH